jgi:hypothetical protein
MMGSKGLTEASKIAILNANYMAKRLEVHYSSFTILYIIIILKQTGCYESRSVPCFGNAPIFGKKKVHGCHL